MAKKKKINIMVASTVYQNRDLLLQICGILNTYGYHVINSEYGTLHPPLGMNNTAACIEAVKDCDIFLVLLIRCIARELHIQNFKELLL